MTKLVNRAKMTTATTGTGTITLGSAVDGYQSFASAGVANGDVVRYVIEDGNNWEIGTGTYTATGTTLSRTVSESSNAGSAINLSGDAVVFVVAAAEEILQESDLTAGTGISIVGSTITNTAPDQTVSLTGSGATSVTGTYPNFTISSTDTNTVPNDATITVSAGGGLTGGGNFTTDQAANETITVSHADTSSQASVNNSGNTFVQDVTLDGYGHVTGLASATVTLSSLGYTGATDADKYTSWTISDGVNSEAVSSGYTLTVADGGATTASFNPTTNTLTISSTDTNTTYSAGTALDLSGTTFNVDLSELATSVTDGDGDFFVVVDSVNAQRKLTKGNINISGFNNDAGYTTNVGDITGVTAGSGLTGGGTSGTVTVSHADTSAQGSVNNSGATVIQDVTLDTYGHVTALGSKTLTAADVGAITGNETITLSGDLSGSGTTSINAQIVANAVGANELNVVGNGTTSQYLRSDGDGTFTWATPPDTNTTYSAGNGISLTGTTFSVAAGGGLTQDASGLSHTDTSTQSSVNNSGNSVIQDVTLDTYGHVTGLASATIIAPTTNGTSGQVLTSNGTATPVWAAPAGGGLLEYVAKAVVTSSTSAVDFTLDNSSYVSHHFVIYNMLPAVNNSRLGFRVSTDGGSTFLSTSIYFSAQSGSANMFSLIEYHSSIYTSGGTVELFNTGSTTARKAVGSAYGGFDTIVGLNNYRGGAGVINTLSAIDAVRFLSAGGNLSSCTIYQYGRPPE